VVLMRCGFPVDAVRAVPEVAGSTGIDDWGMRRTYGVVWLEDDGRLARGKLELLATSVRLDGTVAGTRLTRELSYDELETVHVGRSPGERLNGQTTLVLTPVHGRAITLSCVSSAGSLSELAEQLTQTALTA
jgi:hypothetical protein